MLFITGVLKNSLQILIDPVNEVRGLSVDSRVARLSTAIAPGDNTRELVSTHEGATRVTLAGVLSSLGKTSTDHGVIYIIDTIGITAVSIRNNRDINLLQNSAKASSLSGGAPASDSAHSACIILFSSNRQLNDINELA